MPISADLPPQPGTYILLLEMEEDRAVSIGKLGTFNLDRGWYAYVGSAFGSGKAYAYACGGRDQN